MALGPVVGGALVDSVGWRAVFLVNLPVGLVAIGLTAFYVPESRAARARRIDPTGQLLVITALATLTYAIVDGPSRGWLSGQTLGLFAASAAAFAGLIFQELRREEPLIEVRFFRSAPFSGASAIAVCGFAALSGFLFLNTLYLQNVRGLSPLQAGLYTLPMAGVVLIVAPISGRLVGSRGSRLPLVGGALGLIASAAILTQLSPTTPFGLLVISYLLFGLGFGLINPPITNTGRIRDAAVTGGGRCGRGLDQPAGRPDPGCRRPGSARRRRRRRSDGGRVRSGHPLELVDHRRARGFDPRAGPHHHHRLGAGNRGC